MDKKNSEGRIHINRKEFYEDCAIGLAPFRALKDMKAS
jgi:hypothetical protein